MKKSSATSAKVMAPVMTSEHAETVPLWPLLTSNPPTPISNRYRLFESDDDDESDEEAIVQSLHALTANVQLASDKMKPQKVKKRNQKTMNAEYLHMIAKQVMSGEISMPDIDLDDNSDYEVIWALMDSGAGANVAKRSQFPIFTPVDAPPISLTIANGDTMENNGAGKVTTYTRDGHATTRVFYEAPVDMPILAVSEVAKEGELGSEIKFRAKDGLMVDNLTGRRTHFVKRKGVYFMRMYVRKSSSGFTRPDQ